MRNTVSQTYLSYYWFFIFYRFVVGLIFSQLLVGILVCQFQTTEAERGTITGEVRLALSKVAYIVTPEKQEMLQRELGVLAASLLDPAAPQKPAPPVAPSEQTTNTATKGKDKALSYAMLLTRYGRDLEARLKSELPGGEELNIQTLFNTLDTSGDGSVSLDEMLGLGQAMYGEDKWTVAINIAAFSLLDTDGDGHIDMDEFPLIFGEASDEKFKKLMDDYSAVGAMGPQGGAGKVNTLDMVIDNKEDAGIVHTPLIEL